MFFEVQSWFKFHNLEQETGISLKFYTNVAKRLKLKVRQFWGVFVLVLIVEFKQ